MGECVCRCMREMNNYRSGVHHGMYILFKIVTSRFVHGDDGVHALECVGGLKHARYGVIQHYN